MVYYSKTSVLVSKGLFRDDFQGSFSSETRARDYKEIWSMDWCSTHDCVLNKQKTQKWKFESIFCARFEFCTQTKLTLNDPEIIKISEFKTVLNFEQGSGNSK